ncbi:MAG: methyltransferase domain-containing protein [Methanobacteriota archaeon]
MTKYLRKGDPKGCKAAIVVPFHGERFLLVKGRGGWEFPGGKIEAGESSESAARREMAEETHLSPKRLRFVCLGGPHGECAVYTCELDVIPPIGELFAKPPRRLAFGFAEFRELLGAAWRARTDYDEVSGYFDSVRGTASGPIDVWADKAFGLLGSPAGKLVADIGCGSGKYARSLSDRGCVVVGVDMSGGMLAEAAKKGRNTGCHWARGDAQSLPLKPGSADCALMFLVVHHVPIWQEAISECARLLKPGGTVLLVMTSRSRIRKHLIRFFPGAAEIDLGRFQGLREMRGELSRNGFCGIGVERVLVHRGMVGVDEMVGRYRNRHLSTLSLVPRAEFAVRLVAFEQRLRRRYGPEVPDETELCFISGQLSNL